MANPDLIHADANIVILKLSISNQKQYSVSDTIVEVYWHPF